MMAIEYSGAKKDSRRWSGMMLRWSEMKAKQSIAHNSAKKKKKKKKKRTRGHVQHCRDFGAPIVRRHFFVIVRVRHRPNGANVARRNPLFLDCHFVGTFVVCDV